MTRLLAILGLLVATAGSGCAVAGIAAEMTRPKLPAAHRLDPVTTLILVEDPNLLLRDPSLTTFIANAIAADLRANEALFGAAIVDQRQLQALKADFGGRFGSMALDEVGQRVGAEQVIYVEVLSATFERAPGVFQPQGAVGVKVIDAVARQRVFPPVQGTDAMVAAPRGAVVEARLPLDTTSDDDASFVAYLAEQLARAMASRASELFYDHRPRQPGERLPG